MQLAVCTPNISQLDLDGSTSYVRSVGCGTPFLSKLHFLWSDWRFSFRVKAWVRMHAACSVQTVYRVYHFIAWIALTKHLLIWTNDGSCSWVILGSPIVWKSYPLISQKESVIEGWRLPRIDPKKLDIILENLVCSLL
jgi:hypothetical protein